MTQTELAPLTAAPSLNWFPSPRMSRIATALHTNRRRRLSRQRQIIAMLSPPCSSALLIRPYILALYAALRCGRRTFTFIAPPAHHPPAWPALLASKGCAVLCRAVLSTEYGAYACPTPSRKLQSTTPFAACHYLQSARPWPGAWMRLRRVCATVRPITASNPCLARLTQPLLHSVLVASASPGVRFGVTHWVPVLPAPQYLFVVENGLDPFCSAAPALVAPPACTKAPKLKTLAQVAQSAEPSKSVASSYPSKVPTLLVDDRNQERMGGHDSCRHPHRLVDRSPAATNSASRGRPKGYRQLYTEVMPLKGYECIYSIDYARNTSSTGRALKCQTARRRRTSWRRVPSEPVSRRPVASCATMFLASTVHASRRISCSYGHCTSYFVQGDTYTALLWCFEG